MTGGGPSVPSEDRVRGIGHDLGPAHPLGLRSRAGDHRNRGRRDHRARPKRVDRDAVSAQLLRHAQHAHAHSILRDRVRDVVLEPPWIEVERWRQRQDVRIASRIRRALQMRQTRLRAEE